jgi:hypothetical protein
MGSMRFGRGLFAAGLAVATVCAAASPAAAHGVGGREPTNVRSRILSVSPELAGLHVAIIENGARVQLTNSSDTEVTVLGYEDEPYLRVGPDGVFRNTRSPAVFLNRSLDPPAAVPAGYDAKAAPEWKQLSNADHVRWHDHRAHAMGSGAFDTTQWTIDLRAEGEPIAVRGELAWIEPGPWWPWLLLTLGIALLVALAARAAWRLTVTVVLALLVWAELIHVVGSWSAVALTVPGRLAAQLFSFVALAIGTYALWRASRDEPGTSAPFVLIAAVVFVVAGGIGDVATWFRSQVPSSLPPGAVRTLVAVAFGGGGGLAIAAIMRLAPSRSGAPRTLPNEVASPPA